MKLSSKTQYGIRILVQVAIETQNGKLAQGKEIASAQSINEPYLEQIMVSLKKAGMIQTVRGRRGGYLLGIEPTSVSLLDIIEVFEGPVSLAEANGDADRMPNDSVAEILQKINATVCEETGKVTLADVIEAEQGRLPTYVI